jgi:hypothetical protein
MDWNTIWVMAQPIIAGQIRTVVATGAGALVVDGAIAPSDEASAIKIGTGIVLWAIPAAWSWWEKVGKTKLIAQMAKAPAIVSKDATVGQAVQAAESVAK